ncbi:serine hydrolase domain-containing protein [Henriciella marina]|uniref:Serine hydrolase n=1 Tax=Henriciella marina TaxID=453851 RepID=A0ABT4LT23_9PROT|nr:serine hydrolase [Henriciella marina]MCZ4296688.1 serine hydrolase [Henriciella marina]
MRRLFLSALIVTALAVSPAQSQEGGETEIMQKALAAGYKALFTCSATFTADKSRAEIEYNELDGIYTDYRGPMRSTSEANISDRSRTVAVRYAPGEPPRIAAWREGFGCSLLPIGAGLDDVDVLPRFSDEFPMRQRDSSTALGQAVQLIDASPYAARLEEPVRAAFDGQTYGDDTRTSAVLVVMDGQIMAERYARGINATTPQRTWSVAKSLTASVIGAAIQQGLLDLDRAPLLDAWSRNGDPRGEITLRNVLQMASGLDSGVAGNRTDRTYFGGALVTDTAFVNPLEITPGERFKYSNYDTLAAMRALRETMDDDGAFWGFPYESVLWKIGAMNTVLETDWAGDFISSSQVWMTARDMARLGQLYLQDGMWGDERILAEGWTDFVSSPGKAQPDRSSSPFGYGGSFWLMDRSEGVPADTYAGFGNRGQYLVIIPSLDMVIVRRGFDTADGGRFDVAAFTRDVISAINQGHTDRLDAQAEATAAEAGYN